jgi:cell shape-determining protein MreC
MNAISATRRTVRREWTAFGTLLIISVGLMGISDTTTAHDLQSAVNWVAMPVETVLSDAADTAGSYWSALTQIDQLRTQNLQLKQENLTLQEELNRMSAISKLNDDWTKITAAQVSSPYETTPVRVVVRDLSNVGQQTLIVNKGSRDGLTVGEVVIDAGGALVGRIQKVEATVSTILLISDPTSVVVGTAAGTPATTSCSATGAGPNASASLGTPATGTITGSISGQLQMLYVDKDATLSKGALVYTSGESLPNTTDVSPFPPALLIGTIVGVSCDPNLVVQGATIQPAAHLTDATFLLVITNFQGGFGPLVPPACLVGSASPGTTSSTTTPNPAGSASPAPSCPAFYTASPAPVTPRPAATPRPTPTPKGPVFTPPPY